MSRDRQFTVSLCLYALATIVIALFNILVPPEWIVPSHFSMAGVDNAQS